MRVVELKLDEFMSRTGLSQGQNSVSYNGQDPVNAYDRIAGQPPRVTRVQRLDHGFSESSGVTD
jgi:hypothetical protein